uniref:Uncharacterized protein n=1 Tax=Setaria viridis TaxID=4556 RepID=A0A4U6TAZ3_SETVI|nr:hypothetical protein SEVIR_9G535150v2 [Setaria viridis]
MPLFFTTDCPYPYIREIMLVTLFLVKRRSSIASFIRGRIGRRAGAHAAGLRTLLPSWPYLRARYTEKWQQRRWLDGCRGAATSRARRRQTPG